MYILVYGYVYIYTHIHHFQLRQIERKLNADSKRSPRESGGAPEGPSTFGLRGNGPDMTGLGHPDSHFLGGLNRHGWSIRR